ncbi:MAG: response regulator [Terracidiphilus sp.]
MTPSSLSDRGAACVLSVDDEPGVLLTRQMVLEMAGYEVLNAANGRQALASFDAQPVDLVVLDYRMPGMDGGAVAREMKRRKPLVPVILISAGVVDDDSQACADCFLHKGQGPALLLREMERLIAAMRKHPQPVAAN